MASTKRKYRGGGASQTGATKRQRGGSSGSSDDGVIIKSLDLIEDTVTIVNRGSDEVSLGGWKLLSRTGTQVSCCSCVGVPECLFRAAFSAPHHPCGHGVTAPYHQHACSTACAGGARGAPT